MNETAYHKQEGRRTDADAPLTPECCQLLTFQSAYGGIIDARTGVG